MIETILILCALLVITNLFWAYQCHRLVNKVMSRNYAEYQQLQNPPPAMQPGGITIPLSGERQDLGALEGFGVG